VNKGVLLDGQNYLSVLETERDSVPTWRGSLSFVAGLLAYLQACLGRDQRTVANPDCVGRRPQPSRARRDRLAGSP